MNGRIETADGSRGSGTFPREWGKPPEGDEERAAWIKANTDAIVARDPAKHESRDARKALQAVRLLREKGI